MYRDIIGNTQCDALSDQTVPTKNGSRTYQQDAGHLPDAHDVSSCGAELVLRDARRTGILVDDLLPLSVFLLSLPLYSPAY